MSVTLADAKVRWMVSAAVAIAIVATLAMLFRVPSPTPLPAPSSVSVALPRPAGVQLEKLTNADAVLQQEAEIRDLRPLFLPTEFNATLPEPRLEAGRTFLDNETLKLGFSEAELSLDKDLPPVVALNGKPLVGPPADRAKPVDALLADGSGPSLLGFGRSNIPITPLRARGGFVEVVETATGHRILAEELPLEALPARDKSWEPMEFIATVDAAGLAAPLIVTASSRVEEVDAHFRNFLARRYRIGERLPPGFYRIVVGP